MSFWKRFFSAKAPDSSSRGAGRRLANEEVERIFVDIVKRSGDFSGKLTKDHVRAMMQAVSNVADEMVAAYGDVDRAFFFACQNDGVLGLVVIFHQRGANPSVLVDGLTPLYAAASKGHGPVVDYLVEVGVDPDGRTDEGATPLLIASMKGHLDVVRALIRHGADVDARATNGATPMAVALQEDQLDVIRALKEAGAKPAESRSADDWVIQIKTENSVSYMNIQTGQYVDNPSEASLHALRDGDDDRPPGYQTITPAGFAGRATECCAAFTSGQGLQTSVMSLYGCSHPTERLQL